MRVRTTTTMMTGRPFEAGFAERIKGLLVAAAVAGVVAVVGCGKTKPGPPGPVTGGTVNHWDGTALTLSTATGGANQRYFADVWGGGPNDVWVVGFEGITIHWNGSAWSRVASGTSVALSGIWGSGPNDVWAVGGDGVFHWNGFTWSFATAGTSLGLSGIWGSGPNDVWAVGGDGTVLHWDGSVWSRSRLEGVSFRAVHGSGSSDVWAIGADDERDDIIAHFNGAAWSVNRTGADDGLADVWSVGPDDAWIVGGDTILHWDGSTWSLKFAASEVTGVWGSGPGDLWFVGDHGAKRFDGSVKADVPTSAFETLTHVWGSGPNDVWMVGGVED